MGLYFSILDTPLINTQFTFQLRKKVLITSFWKSLIKNKHNLLIKNIKLYSTGTMFWSSTYHYYCCNFIGACCYCCCYCSLWWVTRYIISKVKIIVTMAIVVTSSTNNTVINITIMNISYCRYYGNLLLKMLRAFSFLVLIIMLLYILIKLGSTLL